MYVILINAVQLWTFIYKYGYNECWIFDCDSFMKFQIIDEGWWMYLTIYIS